MHQDFLCRPWGYFQVLSQIAHLLVAKGCRQVQPFGNCGCAKIVLQATAVNRRIDAAGYQSVGSAAQHIVTDRVPVQHALAITRVIDPVRVKNQRPVGIPTTDSGVYSGQDSASDHLRRVTLDRIFTGGRFQSRTNITAAIDCPNRKVASHSPREGPQVDAGDNRNNQRGCGT